MTIQRGPNMTAVKTLAIRLIRAELLAAAVIVLLSPLQGWRTACVLAAVFGVGFVISFAGITLAGWAWLALGWMLRHRRVLKAAPVNVVDVAGVGVIRS